MLRIRSFRLSDLPSVVRIFQDSFDKYELTGLNTQQIYRLLALRFRYEKYLDRIKKCVFKRSLKYIFTNRFDILILIAEIEGKVVGATFAVNVLDELWSLNQIAVHRNFRGRGIGTQLTKEVIALVKDRGGRKIILNVRPDNFAAVKLYKDLGFLVYDEIHSMELDL